MSYQYEIEDNDYTHFSSGRVFYGVPGIPALPIRLTCEVFLRCKALLNPTKQVVLYDPCCGAAYHLSTLAYRYWDDIQAIYASDIDKKAVDGANRNLSLLTTAGLERRIQEIRGMLAAYGKPAHSEALESALWLKERLIANLQKHAIQFTVFQADATRLQAFGQPPFSHPIDIILADVPYGHHSTWISDENDPPTNPFLSMLDGLHHFMTPDTLLAIISDKSQKVTHPAYRRLQSINFGKRQVVILKRSSIE